MSKKWDSGRPDVERWVVMSRTQELRKVISQVLGVDMGVVTNVFFGSDLTSIAADDARKVRELAQKAGYDVDLFFASDDAFPKVEAYFDPDISMSDNLRAHLDDADYLKLIENFGGTRAYVALRPSHSLFRFFLSKHGVSVLSDALGGSSFKVPLDRLFRATVYRQRGASYGQIAVAIGMTESAVGRLLRREKAARLSAVKLAN